MKGYNDGEGASGPLEQRLRDGLRREAEAVRPEAQAFWTRVAQRMARRRRERGQIKQL